MALKRSQKRLLGRAALYAVLLGLLSTFWLIVASSVGFIRLASEPDGQ